jgi:acyl-CoA thioesterase-1
MIARRSAVWVWSAWLAAATLFLLTAGGEPAPGAAPPRAASPAAVGLIIVFGDSFTAGLGLPSKEAFPAQLEARLRAEDAAVTVIASGVSGETTSGGVARLNAALADRPRLVILELGTNDALRGVQPRLVRAHLAVMIARARSAGAAVLLTGVRAPVTWGEQYRQAFDEVYPRLAHELRVPLYPFFLAGVVGDRRLIQKDGLHPNREGVLVLASKIAPVVARLLETGHHGDPASDPDKIPVATGRGVEPMTPAQYAAAVSSLGSLPVLSKAYVFGRRIPQPRTDANGHIRVQDTDSSFNRQPDTQLRAERRAAGERPPARSVPLATGGSRAAPADGLPR